MKVLINDIGGIIAKEDERYIVKDNTILNNLVVSSTRLQQRKATTASNPTERSYIWSKGAAVLRHRRLRYVYQHTHTLIPIDPC